MNDQAASAIDDCAAAHLFGHAASIPRSGAGAGAGAVPVPFQDGRRPGHWTIGNIVIGSAIDDGYSTVFGIADFRSHSGEARQVQPLNRAALRKLKKATEDDGKNKAVRSEADTLGRKVTTAGSEQRKAGSVPNAIPKGFYAPKAGLGIRIVNKDGTSEILVSPHSAAKSAAGREKVVTKAASALEPVLEASTKPASKVQSSASGGSNSNNRRVRIVGKNGEEAHVELPFVQTGFRPASHVYVPACGGAGEEDEAASKPGRTEVIEGKALKTQQDQKAARAAQALRADRQQQEKREEAERMRQARAAADVVMAGALPGLHSDSSASQPSPGRAAKSASSRSASIINGVFDSTSRDPSKASSRTMTPPPAQTASVRIALCADGQRANSVSIAGWQLVPGNVVHSQKPASSGGWQKVAADPTAPAQVPRSARAKTTSRANHGQATSTSVADWQQVGSGVMPANFKTPSPTPQLSLPQHSPAVRRKKAETPPSRPISITPSEISRKIAGIRQWNHATPSVNSRRVPAPSILHSPPPAIQTQLLKDASRETIYAGTGWISPHPLSRAPTELASPPQDKISIQGATMTYAEWKQLREQTQERERRNFSRASSEGRTVGNGRWGSGVRSKRLGWDAGSDRRSDWEVVPAGAPPWDIDPVPTVNTENSGRAASRPARLRTSGQKSTASVPRQGGNESTPLRGRKDVPLVDGAGDAERKPRGMESSVTFAEENEEDGRVLWRLPWDKVAHAGSQTRW